MSFLARSFNIECAVRTRKICEHHMDDASYRNDQGYLFKMHIPGKMSMRR